jgi:hypothetical protein
MESNSFEEEEEPKDDGYQKMSERAKKILIIVSTIVIVILIIVLVFLACKCLKARTRGFRFNDRDPYFAKKYTMSKSVVESYEGYGVPINDSSRAPNIQGE